MAGWEGDKKEVWKSGKESAKAPTIKKVPVKLNDTI